MYLEHTSTLYHIMSLRIIVTFISTSHVVVVTTTYSAYWLRENILLFLTKLDDSRNILDNFIYCAQSVSDSHRKPDSCQLEYTPCTNYSSIYPCAKAPRETVHQKKPSVPCPDIFCWYSATASSIVAVFLSNSPLLFPDGCVDMYCAYSGTFSNFPNFS